MGKTHQQQCPQSADLSADYYNNRRAFPSDELVKFAGKHVAFSLDGKRILASGDSEKEMEDQLIAAGIDPSRVVGSYVPPADLALLL